MSPRVLACFGHPDDEAFGTGGTLAKLAARGVGVTLVCATRGEVGEISDPALATPERLGEVREQELRCAAQALGIDEPIFLGYRDSGMAGTAENEDPRAFMNADPEEVLARLVKLMRDLRPQAVVTFEPGGGYGHPDHMTISRLTTQAFELAADGSALPGLGDPWSAERLFYTAIPRSFFERLAARMRELGMEPPGEDLPKDDARGLRDDSITTVVDVSATVDAKWAAINCHRTQYGAESLFRRLPAAEMRDLMSSEYFALARTHGNGHEPPRDDLLA